MARRKKPLDLAEALGIDEYLCHVDVLGQKTWYDENGELHRDNDKPAYIGRTGTQCWIRHGKLHRDNGKPAVIYFDRRPNEFWKHGVQIK